MSRYIGRNEVVDMGDGKFYVNNNPMDVAKVRTYLFECIKQYPDLEGTSMLDILTAVACVCVGMGIQQRVAKGSILNIISNEWERTESRMEEDGNR